MTIRLGRQDSKLTNVEHLAWKSLRTLILTGMPQLERTFRHYGLVQVEYHILAELYDRQQGMRLGELAAAVAVSPSRLSHRIEKLSGSGLVTLEATDSDARATLAFITHTGRALVDRLAARHEEDIRRVLFEPLQAQQVRALADALSTIVAAQVAGEVGEDVELPGHASQRGGPQEPEPARTRRWRGSLLKEWPRRS